MKLVSLIVLFSIVATCHAAEIRWQERKDGTHFMLLEGRMSYVDAYRACAAKGWDIFNYEYLSPEEQEAIKASPRLESMQWDRKNEGEPSERVETTVWMSSSFGTITWNSYEPSMSVLALQRFANESTRRVPAHVGTRDPSQLRQGLCMYQSHTWEGCSQEMTCTYETPDGGTYNIRHSLYEYGPTRSLALSRIRAKVKNFDGGIGGKCELSIKDPLCLNYRATSGQ